MRQAFEIKADGTFDSVEANRYHGPCIAIKVGRNRIRDFLDQLKSPSLDVGGVYLLLSDIVSGKKVYVGESEPVYKRIRQHLANPVFDWEEAIIFIGSASDHPWEKSSIKYLEHALHRDLKDVSNYEVQNKNTPTQSKVAYPWEWDAIADEIKVLTQFLGHPHLFKAYPSLPMTGESVNQVKETFAKDVSHKPSQGIGKMVQAIFPWLFANGHIGEKELKYLLSAQARADFKLGGKDFRVLLDCSKKEHGFVSGSFRYYPNIELPLNGKKYFLSNQFRSNGRTALLAWLESLGVTSTMLEGILSHSTT